jgi:hypothetical protein
MTSVAVAVNGVAGGNGGRGSRRTVRWAVENLMPTADRFVLIHVMPKITSIPTPCMFLHFFLYFCCVWFPRKCSKNENFWCFSFNS